MSAVHTDRKGRWMQTYSGLAYWPLDPRAAEVRIVDIAHALSMLCRYGGHCKNFYSVAEHSVHVSMLVPPEHALVALLHDAAEAYCADVPRPLKKCLDGYARIEQMNWHAIAARFKLSQIMPDTVAHADIAMLFAEQKMLMVASPREDWGMGLTTPITADVQIKCWSPDEAERAFLQRFAVLVGKNKPMGFSQQA